MISEFKEWGGVVVLGLSGIAAWFNLKSDVRMIESRGERSEKRIKAIEEKEPPIVDLSQVAKNTLAIQRLELANERAEEQRLNLMRMVEKTQEGVEKQTDKQDKFQNEILQGITKLSTELQERTKALHS